MKSKEECTPCVPRAARLDLIITVCQTVFKTIMAQLTGSVALGAASLVSLSDVISKVITLVSVKVARLPPNSYFPYGYGKIQFLSAMIIGITLIAGAFHLLIDNVWVVDQPNSVPPSYLGLVAIVVSIGASVIMYSYLKCVGTKNENSNILAAASDNLLDVISGIVVFIGIALGHLGWEDGDYWAAVLISFIVMYVGGQISYEALRSLLDVSIPEKTLDMVHKVSRRTQGVLEVDFCRGRNLGGTWELSLQVSIDNNLTTKAIQQLNETLRDSIKKAEPLFSFIQISNRMVKKKSLEHVNIIDAFKENS